MNADSSEAITQTKHKQLDLSLSQDFQGAMQKTVDNAEGEVADILYKAIETYQLFPVKARSRIPNLGQSVNKVYRFYLPTPASEEQVVEFRQNVEFIRRANPEWEISPELPEDGEAEVVVMIYSGDGNYLNRRADYVINQINQSLTSFLQGGYDEC
ncbi:hypothetical protein [Pseudanabaena sp. UWO310]|uniref:hypothetical protein n=1 Tax=Pseudanabaena sp. UWO310 TaxID=2480795 RepID=UPI0011608B72|nr:hypothetical protein [Pseudanabaena sp. UWO310]TYQ24863.1 hypothetical protein PseudUWO310_20120 [Pseudanabaena sp. UWO310]